jgi:hypothetical protein
MRIKVYKGGDVVCRLHVEEEWDSIIISKED